jgi:nucleotide-binding universal stress UspA family protein
MNTVPDVKLHLVVGYDGSPPAVRALDGAVRLLSGREGEIVVHYVAHLAAADSLSADAMVEVRQTFEEAARDLREQAAEQLRGREERWQFEWREGPIAEELAAAAKRIAESAPGDTVVIVVGSSSHAMHRLIGSVPVILSRHTTVPLVIVP